MDNYPLVNTDIWQELEEIGGGVKKLIKGDGSEQRVAYFKPLSRRSGPTGANEYITFKLATLLELPVAEIQLIKFNAVDGFLSLEISNSNPWQVFPDKANSKPFLEDENIISKILAFDLWVRNKDRHDRNLVFQRSSKQKGKYQIYMIDNEFCLYGPDQGPPATFDDYGDIVKIPELSKQIATEEELMIGVNKVMKISNDSIANIIDNFLSAAPLYINTTQAGIIKDILLTRKNQLPEKAKEWYNSSRNIS